MLELLKAVFSDNYGISITFALGFYGLTRLIFSYFSEELKEEISAGVIANDAEENWAVTFKRAFEAVFDTSQFTWKCVRRSFTISSVAVFFFGAILFAGDMLIYRAQDETSILLIIPTLLIVNYVADFVSIYETRFLLSVLSKTKSVPRQIGLLIIDFVLSAVIVWVVIWVYFQLPFYKGPADTFAEVIGAFSLFSVCFYSTFVTSFWSWIYCLTVWFMRILKLFGPKNLAVKEKPALFVGSYMTVIAFLVCMGTLTLIQRSPFEVSRFETYLCRGFNGPVCEHISRQADGSTFKSEMVNDPKFQLLLRVCPGQHPTKCILKHPYLGKRYEEISLNYCEASDANACYLLGTMFENGHGVPLDDVRAAANFRLACRKGFMPGCDELGWMYANGEGVPQDDVQSVAMYRRACDGGRLSGCSGLAWMYANGRGVPQDDKRAVALYQKACDGGTMRGCSGLGWMFANGRGVPQDDLRAVELYQQACEGGEAQGCGALGWMFEGGFGVLKDSLLSLELYEKACDGGDSFACNNLGRRLSGGDGVPQDEIRAIALFEQACEGGVSAGCHNLARIYENGISVPRDMSRALALYKQACSQDNEGSCRKVTLIDPFFFWPAE